MGRAGQLPDRQLTAEMLELFGRSRGRVPVPARAHEEASMTQALHLINGKSVTSRLASPNSKLASWCRRRRSPTSRSSRNFTCPSCVECRDRTSRLMRKHLTATGDRLKAQDVMWVLLNSKEFLFNY
jgi:hypothetical protein